MHYLLYYDVVDNYIERREPLRAAHLANAAEAVERGDLVLGGALADPVDGAILLSSGDSPQADEAFVASDPFVTGGLVTDWRVRVWATVVDLDAPVQV
jgi:hypothetical protein